MPCPQRKDKRTRRAGCGIAVQRERERRARVRSAGRLAEGPAPGPVGALAAQRADSDASEHASARRDRVPPGAPPLALPPEKAHEDEKGGMRHSRAARTRAKNERWRGPWLRRTEQLDGGGCEWPESSPSSVAARPRG